MTASTVSRAARDPDLIARVTALAHREIVFDPDLAETDFGRQLASGAGNVNALMYPIAVDTEAAYETAVNSGRGAPGYDVDIITDAAITAAIAAHWPPDLAPPTAPGP